jgi:hypothetical protein
MTADDRGPQPTLIPNDGRVFGSTGHIADLPAADEADAIDQARVFRHCTRRVERRVDIR